MARCWTTNCTTEWHTAKVLLKDAGERFPSLQCFFPRTALLCVMAPFTKYDQRLLKSVERFPLNPDDVLVLLSWAGLHRGFLLLVLCGRLEPWVICNGKGYLLWALQLESKARLGSVLVSYRLLVVVYFSFAGKCLGLGAAWACLGALIPSAGNDS